MTGAAPAGKLGVRFSGPGSPRLIVGNAIFLGVMAVFGFSQDVLSYQFGMGSFHAFLLGDPRAIGLVEAHGLAGGIALAAYVHARRTPLFWHGLLAAVHAFLASSNLIFFDGFVETGTTVFATLVTAVHYGLTLLHAGALSRSRGARRVVNG